MNPAMARLFGLNPDAAVDLPWHEQLCLDDEADRTRLAGMIASALEGRTPPTVLPLAASPGNRRPARHAEVHTLPGNPPEALLLVRHSSAAQSRPDPHRLETYLQHLDRFAAAMARAADFDTALDDILEVVRASFDADRAWLIFPCDPEAAEWHVPFEATHPQFPGVAARGGKNRMSPEIAEVLRDALAASGPVIHPDVARIGSATLRGFRIESQMMTVLRPRGGPPWILGLHSCRARRDWTPQESHLFNHIAERLADALTQRLLQRRLREDIRHREDIERALLRTLADHRRLMDAIPDIIFTLNPAGQLVRWNAALERICGRGADSLRGTSVTALFPENERNELAAHIRNCLGVGRAEAENELTTADGSLRLFHWILVSLLDQNGNPTGITAVGRDITLRRHTQAQLRRTAAVFEDALEGFLIMDRTLRIEAANRAFHAMTGWPPEHVVGKDLFELGWLSEKPVHRRMREQLADSGRWQGEMWTRGRTPAFCRLSINAVYDTAGQVESHVLVSTNITELRQTQEQLQYMAHYDPLTGLANRVLFGTTLEHAIEDAIRNDECFALLYIDLDGFKKINDELGHQAGDQLLAALGKRLSQVVREKRTTARLGGDEFTVILRRIEDADAIDAVARRVLKTLNEPIALGDRRVQLSASIGIALFPAHGRSADTLLNAADQAMYAAKARGDTRYAVAPM